MPRSSQQDALNGRLGGLPPADRASMGTGFRRMTSGNAAMDDDYFKVPENVLR